MTDEQQTDEQTSGAPQQEMEESGVAQQDEAQGTEGGGDTPEGKAEQGGGGGERGTADEGAGDEPRAESGEDEDTDTKIDPDDDEETKAKKAQAKMDSAKEEIKELEEKDPDELPTDIKDWPSGAAKYETFGGPEGEESYDESVTRKLGPSSLRHHEDGRVEIEGEDVDDPENYKGEPIPGGPTDPDSPLNEDERAAARVKEKEESDEDSPRGGREYGGDAEGSSGEDGDDSSSEDGQPQAESDQDQDEQQQEEGQEEEQKQES